MPVSLAEDAKHHRIGQFLNWPMNAPPGRSILIQVSPHIKNSGPPNGGPEFLVGVGRLELPASWSRTKRATSCATPRNSFYIIMTGHTIVKRKNRRSPSVPQKERRGTASASRLSCMAVKTLFSVQAFSRPPSNLRRIFFVSAAMSRMAFFSSTEQSRNNSSSS